MEYQNIVDLEKHSYSKQSHPSSALTAVSSSSSQSIQRELLHYQSNIGSSSETYNNFNNNNNTTTSSSSNSNTRAENNYNSNRTHNHNNQHAYNSNRNSNTNFEIYNNVNDTNINYEPDPTIQKGIMLYCFSLVSGLSIISAILVAFTQIISIIYKLDVLFFDDTTNNNNTSNHNNDVINNNNNNNHTTNNSSSIHSSNISYLRIYLQLYDIAFCIYILLAEMDFDLFKQTFFLENWFSRGLIYIFISLLIFDDVDTARVWRRIMDLSGIMLLSMGITYLLMSVFCLRKIRDQKMARYVQLLASYEIQQVTNTHFGAFSI